MYNKTVAALAKKVASLGSIFQIPRVPGYGENEKKRFRKEVVRQISKRNISLRLAYYVTADDIDRMKKELGD